MVALIISAYFREHHKSRQQNCCVRCHASLRETVIAVVCSFIIKFLYISGFYMAAHHTGPCCFGYYEGGSNSQVTIFHRSQLPGMSGRFQGSGYFRISRVILLQRPSLTADITIFELLPQLRGAVSMAVTVTVS